MVNFLQDKDFLNQLTHERHKIVYIRIIALNFDEEPLQYIEGRATSGSINFDGTSAVRRTCSLSLVAEDINLNDFYWGVSNKFSLEIGLKNTINNIYPDICWFKQGIYVITSFNANLANNSYTISISGKDKMCLLNGDIGGSLPSSVDFGKIDTYSEIYTEVTLDSIYDFEVGSYYVYDKNKKGYALLTE